MKPDARRALASLKDFQSATADYAFRRLWLDDDQVKRFLVADEVGLGKTMVAKGVIAKTVEHLWPTDKRIDIVYICSNTQIARQNLSRLNVVGGSEVKHADRLTLLPKVIRSLRDQRINFVSFTPGTSFQVGRSGGAFRERVMHLLDARELLGHRGHATGALEEVLRGRHAPSELRERTRPVRPIRTRQSRRRVMSDSR